MDEEMKTDEEKEEFLDKAACAVDGDALSPAGAPDLPDGTGTPLWVPAAVGVGAAVAVGSFISEGISALVDDIFCW